MWNPEFKKSNVQYLLPFAGASDDIAIIIPYGHGRRKDNRILWFQQYVLMDMVILLFCEVPAIGGFVTIVDDE